MVVLFSYTNGAYEFCFEFCVVEVFQVLGKDSMDYGIRGAKSLRLGCPRHPKVIFKDNQASKLGDAPDGIPPFVFNPSVNLLEAIFLYTTWYVFCLEGLV